MALYLHNLKIGNFQILCTIWQTKLGFLHIYDGTFDDEEKIETLKLSLSEVIISIFEEHVKKYNSENGKNELDINSIVDDDFDFSTNRNKNYEVLNFDFEIEDYTDLLKMMILKQIYPTF